MSYYGIGMVITRVLSTGKGQRASAKGGCESLSLASLPLLTVVMPLLGSIIIIIISAFRTAAGLLGWLECSIDPGHLESGKDKELLG